MTGDSEGHSVKSRNKGYFQACIFKKMNKQRIQSFLNPVWLYRTGNSMKKLPPQLPGINVTNKWAKIIDEVRKEQDHRDNLKVLIYPCAFLQLLEKNNSD